MIALPVPLFTAAVLAYLAIHAAVLGETSRMVIAFVAMCAVQSAVIALNQHYGLRIFGPLQPVTASTLAVFAYLTFLATSVRPLRVVPDSAHLLAPASVAACLWLPPLFLDGMLMLLFAGYGTAILFKARNGADDLPLVRLEGSDRALFLWRCVAGAMMASAAFDLIISVAVTYGPQGIGPLLVSLYSVVFLLMVGLLSLSETVSRPLPQDPVPGASAPASHTVAHPDLMHRIEDHMRTSKIYLDPDLTLRKLSRQLSVPEKTVSASINRATGENLPRYINRHRIEHACELMQAGTPVTHAIYASGFNTKSNFNREFLRLKGLPPSAWLDAHGSP